MKKQTTIAKQAIDIVLWVFVSLLLIRFALVLVGANPRADFMQWVFATTKPLLVPFKGLFNNVGAERYVLELNTIAAIVVYSILATLLIKLVDFLSLSDSGEDK